MINTPRALACAAAAFLAGGCIGESTGPNAALTSLHHSPGHGGGGGGGDISLVITLPDVSDTDARIVNDARNLADGGNDYADGVCGVYAAIEPGSDNTAFLDPDRSKIKKPQESACGGSAPRFIELRFVDLVEGVGNPETVLTTGVMTVRDVISIATGTTELRNARVNNAKCGLVGFNGEGNPGGQPSNQVQVTRDSDSTWTVVAEPPNDLAFCRDEGKLWHMPFVATLRER